MPEDFRPAKLRQEASDIVDVVRRHAHYSNNLALREVLGNQFYHTSVMSAAEDVVEQNCGVDVVVAEVRDGVEAADAEYVVIYKLHDEVVKIIAVEERHSSSSKGVDVAVVPSPPLSELVDGADETGRHKTRLAGRQLP